MIIAISYNSPKFGSLSAIQCAEILDEHYVRVDEKNSHFDPMTPVARFLDMFEGNLLDLLSSFLQKETLPEEDSKKIKEAVSFYYDQVIPEWRKIRNNKGVLRNSFRCFLNIF